MSSHGPKPLSPSSPPIARTASAGGDERTVDLGPVQDFELELPEAPASPSPALMPARGRTAASSRSSGRSPRPMPALELDAVPASPAPRSDDFTHARVVRPRRTSTEGARQQRAGAGASTDVETRPEHAPRFRPTADGARGAASSAEHRAPARRGSGRTGTPRLARPEDLGLDDEGGGDDSDRILLVIAGALVLLALGVGFVGLGLLLVWAL